MHVNRKMQPQQRKRTSKDQNQHEEQDPDQQISKDTRQHEKRTKLIFAPPRRRSCLLVDRSPKFVFKETLVSSLTAGCRKAMPHR